MIARLLNDYYVAKGRSVAAFDLADEVPRLVNYVTGANIVDIGDICEQVAFFDGLIVGNEIVKVIDVGYRDFMDFFSIVRMIGLFEEAHRRNIKPLVLFVIDPTQKTLKIYETLRHSFSGVLLVPVRNRLVADSLCDRAFCQTSEFAVPLEIPMLDSSSRSLIDCEGFSFGEAWSNGVLLRSEDELQKWSGPIHWQFRELELAAVN